MTTKKLAILMPVVFLVIVLITFLVFNAIYRSAELPRLEDLAIETQKRSSIVSQSKEHGLMRTVDAISSSSTILRFDACDDGNGAHGDAFIFRYVFTDDNGSGYVCYIVRSKDVSRGMRLFDLASGYKNSCGLSYSDLGYTVEPGLYVRSNAVAVVGITMFDKRGTPMNWANAILDSLE